MVFNWEREIIPVVGIHLPSLPHGRTWLQDDLTKQRRGRVGRAGVTIMRTFYYAKGYFHDSITHFA